MDELWGRVIKVHDEEGFQLELGALETANESQYEPLEDVKHREGTVVVDGDRVHVLVRERDGNGWLCGTVTLNRSLTRAAGDVGDVGDNEAWDSAEPAATEGTPVGIPLEDAASDEDVGPADSATTLRRRRAGTRFRRQR